MRDPRPTPSMFSSRVNRTGKMTLEESKSVKYSFQLFGSERVERLISSSGGSNEVLSVVLFLIC